MEVLSDSRERGETSFKRYKSFRSVEKGGKRSKLSLGYFGNM